jgi:hypothetical protein
MKAGDRSAAARRIEVAISQIEAEVALLNGVALPVNEFGAIVPSADVPTAPTIDAADEQPADFKTLLPPIDLSGCKVVSLPASRRRFRAQDKGASRA